MMNLVPDDRKIHRPFSRRINRIVFFIIIEPQSPSFACADAAGEKRFRFVTVSSPEAPWATRLATGACDARNDSGERNRSGGFSVIWLRIHSIIPPSRLRSARPLALKTLSQ
jgi:hypothetical protein